MCTEKREDRTHLEPSLAHGERVKEEAYSSPSQRPGQQIPSAVQPRELRRRASAALRLGQEQSGADHVASKGLQRCEVWCESASSSAVVDLTDRAPRLVHSYAITV